MQINSNDEKFGLPVIKLREFLKRHSYNWGVESLMNCFDLSRDKADAIMIKLEEEGYIEKTNIDHEEQLWRNTTKGNALALASAAKPILRNTAEKKINEFLARVKEVNSNEYYLYKIRKVILFGSYLGEAEKLGDIDLAIEIIPKETDPDKFQKLSNDRSEEAKYCGRHFSNYLEELYWPQSEVLKYLKSRSRSISIHFTSDSVLKNSKYKVIFEEV